MWIFKYRVRAFGGAVFSRSSALLVACAALLIAQSGAARSQSPTEQDQLFQQMVRNPGNHEVTFAYVKIATGAR